MNIKKGLLVGLAALGLSATAQASPINVGGVVWDPDATLAFPELGDFTASGGIFEEVASGTPGETVSGYGKVERLNSAVNNEAMFCPGCELTFTFSMDLVSFVGAPNAGLGGIDGDFTFENLNIKFFVDNVPDYIGAQTQAANGSLWLELELNPANLLTGTGTALGSGSDQGTGSGVLDVIGGLAMGNFNTNGEAAGGDITLTSQFQPLIGAPGTLEGGFTLSGNSIPEPTSVALLGLGLLGFAASRKRKA